MLPVVRRAGLGGMVALLRDAPWLDRDRAKVYAWLLAIFMAIALLYGWSTAYLGHHVGAPAPIAAAAGKPQPVDFVAFWSAGRLAEQGRPQAAYDLNAISGQEHAAAALAPDVTLPFFYPPPFLVVCVPFALLPYFGGLLAFVAAQMAALLAVLRRIEPAGWGWLPLLAFPGLLINAATGQNGCITATLFALPMLLLDRQPFLAGLCFGGLVYKPQLALCVPVALLAARRWRAVAGAALSSVLIVLLSLAIFGTDVWWAFLHAARLAQSGLADNRAGWNNLQSLFAAARLAGAPVWLAYGLQAVLAATVLAALALIARRRPGGGAEAALVSAAAVLCTPYVLDYDLALAGAPLAWLAARAQRGGWLPWEKLLCGAAFLWPLVARQASAKAGLPLGPLILLGLFAMVARRAWAGSRSAG